MNLRETLKARGFTGKRFAKLTGAPYATVMSQTCGARGIGIVSAKRYAPVLKMSIEEVLSLNQEGLGTK